MLHCYLALDVAQHKSGDLLTQCKISPSVVNYRLHKHTPVEALLGVDLSVPTRLYPHGGRRFISRNVRRTAEVTGCVCKCVRRRCRTAYFAVEATGSSLRDTETRANLREFLVGTSREQKIYIRIALLMFMHVVFIGTPHTHLGWTRNTRRVVVTAQCPMQQTNLESAITAVFGHWSRSTDTTQLMVRVANMERTVWLVLL